MEGNTSFFVFIRAIINHWLVLMSGGIITVALGVFERFSGRNIPLWGYVTILASFVFLASFLAWREKVMELNKEAARNGLPEITGDITETYSDFEQVRDRSGERVDAYYFKFNFSLDVVNRRPPETTIKEIYLKLLTDKDDEIELPRLRDPLQAYSRKSEPIPLRQGVGQKIKLYFGGGPIQGGRVEYIKEATAIVIDAFGAPHEIKSGDISIKSQQDRADYLERWREGVERDKIKDQERRITEALVREGHERDAKRLLAAEMTSTSQVQIAEKQSAPIETSQKDKN